MGHSNERKDQSGVELSALPRRKLFNSGESPEWLRRERTNVINAVGQLICEHFSVDHCVAVERRKNNRFEPVRMDARFGEVSRIVRVNADPVSHASDTYERTAQLALATYRSRKSDI